MELKVTDEGEIVLVWWTPEGADLLCSLCGECEGWRKRVEDLGYGLSLPPCPVASASPYCG
jgi:hypothetical protein